MFLKTPFRCRTRQHEISVIALCMAIFGGSFEASTAMTLKSTSETVVQVWGSFSKRVYSRPNEATNVDIAHVISKKNGHPGVDFWIVERLVENGPESKSITWATSHDCPSLIAALEKLKDLEPITFTPPGASVPGLEELVVVADGGTYTLDGEGRYPKELTSGHVHYEAGAETPVARWVDDALISLQPCWTGKPPAIAP